ncbi:MAG: hypothetical protein HY927_06115 [Elusimicrobia bacterium]|nr:hypothetical protein [Elusimicrobiota bacterium]
MKFDLIANAKDSLAHAVSHLTDSGDKSGRRWKIAVREVAQVIELLLKERLRRAHPALMWQKVDDYPSTEARTVGAEHAAVRLSKMCGVLLPKGAAETLKACRILRNRIEHYEFELNEPEARGIVGRMLSFIFEFSRCHLGLDLEQEFRKEDSWKALIEIYEFREAQSALVVRQLAEEKASVEICPSCAEATFDVDAEECRLCGHKESFFECDQCHQLFWESGVEYFEDPESGQEATICKKCIRDSDEADYLYEMWRDREAEREAETERGV